MDCEPTHISKRSTRSLVWNHFSKSLETAVCNYCKREFRIINASTTNLRDHLMRHHREYVKDIALNKIIKPVNRNEAQLTIGTSSVSPYNQKGRRSSIWNHFVRDEERQVAVCKNCKKEYKICGNTSNFLRHFVCCHKPRNVERKKMVRSPVWNHFVKSNIPQFVICKHCKKEFKMCGNTSNLINHLRRHHKEVTVSSIDRNIEDNMTFGLSKEKGANAEEPESLLTRCTNFIWLHFKKGVDTAVCNYCSKEINMYGNTFSLRHHLRTYHKEKITQNQDEVLTNLPLNIKSEVDNFVLLDGLSCEDITEESLNIDNFVILENSSCKDVSNSAENMDTLMSLENSYTAKQPYKSFVWKHFRKHKDANTAVCIYCNQERKTSGNTSNLKLHLMRHHRDQIVDKDGENSIFHEESGKLFENSQSNERCWSFVWNHFTKSETKHRAICNYCLKDCNTTSGNTTSLKFHLERYHPEKINKEREKIVKIPSPIKKNTQKRVSSFVWRHFDKSQTPQKAVCLYCKQEYNTSGNTTNLKDHLMRFHKEQLMCDEYQGRITNATLDEETDELISDSYMISENFSENEAEAEDSQTVNELPVPEVVSYQQIFPEDWCKVEENTEQTEENEFSEHENDLDEYVPKKRERSFVWRHFEKSEDSYKVVCSYCAKEFKNCRNTSNLKVHLVKHHREELMFDGTHDISLPHTVQRKRKSFVWDHFKKGTDRYKAICNYCQKECKTYGNTTNIRFHLMRYHKNVLGYDEIKNPLDAHNEGSYQQTESKTSRSSFVWKHFRKGSSQWLAVCNHCNKLCKTYGNTTQLRDHLMRHHGIKDENIHVEDLEQDKEKSPKLDEKCTTDLDDFLVVLSQKNPKRACRSFVWNHFTKSPIPWFAICNYCNKLCKTCGNTSNLRNHLVRHHQKEISEDAEIVDVEPNQESDEEINDDIFIVPEQDTHISEQKINADDSKGNIVVPCGDSTRRERSNKSFVWDHFIKSPFENKATCSHCKKVCNTYGNTTNMKVHLMRHHKGMLADGEESRKRDKYYIWNHFKKTDVRHRAACNYCKKEYNTCGNSTRLRTHLVRYHGDAIDHDNTDGDFTNQANAPEDGFGCTDSETSSTDMELDDFNDTHVPEYVACNFCKKSFTVTSLKNHMTTCHKKEIQDHGTDDFSMSNGAWNERSEPRECLGKYVKDGVTIDYEGKNCKIADNLGNEFVILVVA